MTPLSLSRRQETVRFSEVGCSAPEIQLNSAQDALTIKVDSGPKQSFQIKKIDGGEYILADTPLIPAGESYVWKPTTKGTYSITSTIYDGLATTITVGHSTAPTPHPNTNHSMSSTSSSSKGSLAAVDDFVRFPLAPQHRPSLIGVSTSSSMSTSSPLSSSFGTPLAASTASSSSHSGGGISGSGDNNGAVFRLNRAGSSSPSSASAISLPGRAQRFEEDEEYSFEELQEHPSIEGLRRRRSVGTDTRDRYEEEEQQQQGASAGQNAIAGGGATSRPFRRHLAALQQPFRGSFTSDLDNDTSSASSSPLQPCSPLAGPPSNSTTRFGSGGGGGGGYSNSRFSAYTEPTPVKLFDGSRPNSLVNTFASNGGGSGSVGGGGGSAPRVVVATRADSPEAPISLPRCPRCQKDYVCHVNQQRCVASHIKKGKQNIRHPPVAAVDHLVSFWNSLNKEQRLDILDYSNVPEASNAFYQLEAGIKNNIKSSFTAYSTNSTTNNATVMQLETAGKLLAATIKASDKIDEITGEQFLRFLDAATEGTLLFGSSATAAGGGTGGGTSGGKDSASVVGDGAATSLASISFSSSSLSSFLASTVVLGSVLGSRLITALKAEQKRKSELARSELEALMEEEQQQQQQQHIEEEKKKNLKAKNSKKKNKNKKKANAAVSSLGNSKATSTTAEEEEKKEMEKEDAVTFDNNDDDLPVSVPHQVHRPVFDSCLDETEVLVDAMENKVAQKLPEEETFEAFKEEKEEAGEREDEIGLVRVEDSADGLGQTTVVEAEEEGFIVDFSDDNEQKEEEAVEMPFESVAEAPPPPAAAVVAVKKMSEKKSSRGAKKNVVAPVEKEKPAESILVAVGAEPAEQPQQQQQLSKSAIRRQARKNKDQLAELASAAKSEAVPGGKSSIERVVEAPKTFKDSVSTTTADAAAAAPAAVPRQGGRQGRRKKKQQQAEAAVADGQQQATPLSEAPVPVEKKEEKKESTPSEAEEAATTAAAADLTPAAPAMPEYYGTAGYAPGYQHMGYYLHYNPMFAHPYLMPPPPDAGPSAAGAAAAGLPLSPVPPGAPAHYRPFLNPYLMPLPPHPHHPGMMQMMPLPPHPHAHPIGEEEEPSPVVGAPAPAGFIGVAARAAVALPTDTSASVSSAADGVAVGVPITTTQEPQQQQPEEAAAAPQQVEQVVDADRFKKMLWEAQVRSVNGKVAVLCSLIAKRRAADMALVLAYTKAEHPLFNSEMAERYFEVKSRELIGENDSSLEPGNGSFQIEEEGTTETTAAVAVISPAVAVATAAPPPTVAPPPSLPKNPYLNAALLSRTSSNTNSTANSANGDQQKSKRRPRGPRNRISAAAGGNIGGGEAPLPQNASNDNKRRNNDTTPAHAHQPQQRSFLAAVVAGQPQPQTAAPAAASAIAPKAGVAASKGNTRGSAHRNASSRVSTAPHPAPPAANEGPHKPSSGGGGEWKIQARP